MKASLEDLDQRARVAGLREALWLGWLVGLLVWGCLTLEPLDSHVLQGELGLTLSLLTLWRES